jgi:D-lactate dehydrogenase
MSDKPNLSSWSERLLDRLAFSRDASLYRLIPKAVVRPADEEEVRELLRFARETHTPVTFRTGGTSLSGQSVTEGIMAEVVRDWDRIDILEEGRAIRLQPGVIGARANQYLQPYHRKIGPDPASINAAMIGGIISNNSSGMVCGVKNNAYHTLKSIRFMLANGRLYDTSKPDDYARFNDTETTLCQGLLKAKKQIESEPRLRDKIRRKYLIKNTLGYSLNAFLDFDHPLDIFSHLLVGAEGTLAFLSSVNLKTIPDPEFKSTGLAFFKTPKLATEIIPFLIKNNAAAVELMDSASLKTAQYAPKAPYRYDQLEEDTTALLIELQQDNPDELSQVEKEILQHLVDYGGQMVAGMTKDSQLRTLLWNIRKGLYPTVGALRKSGTSVITEDICYQYTDLPEVVQELKSIFKKWSYHDSVIFGHAKDGNLHFVASIDLNQPEGIRAFDGLMNDLVSMTVDQFSGSLKAEHGTGRNMAPFVETEWGGALYELMWGIKSLADPHNILNPGVLLNRDEKIHLKHLKPIPKVHESIDLCVECGFCERVCPSRELTLTPRQRIVIARELELQQIPDARTLKDFGYSGLDTCAVDGMCATACPVHINTGSYVKKARSDRHGPWAEKFGFWTSNHFILMQSGIRGLLKIAHGISRITGPKLVENLSAAVDTLLPVPVPRWTRYVPKAAPAIKRKVEGTGKEWIYYPSCITRVFSVDHQTNSLADLIFDIGRICHLQIRTPEGYEPTCCGTPYSSKGYQQADQTILTRTIGVLFEATQGGENPILIDTSPCSQKLLQAGNQLQGEVRLKWKALTFVDIVPFLHERITQEPPRKKLKREIVLHPTCSTVKMDQDSLMSDIGRRCAEKVTVPSSWNCCAFAGDRGLLFPELTYSATRREAEEVKSSDRVTTGYSSSRTCEIGLTQATEVAYTSIVALVRDYLRQEPL